MSTFQTSDDFLTEAILIVDVNGTGTHTTIGAALSAASAGTTIFIKPGTYTENPALVAGVNLTAWLTDADSGTVIINGKCTFSSAGTVIISGIQLLTNSDYFLSITGANASVVQLLSCYLNALNNTGINSASSSSSSVLLLYDCGGNLGTTGIAMFSDSSTGTLQTFFSTFDNSGASTTASTKSAGVLFSNQSRFTFPITYSSSSTASGMNFDQMNTSGQNATCFTTSGTGAITLSYCLLLSGSASALSVGADTTVGTYACTINSSNASVITGGGTCNYTGTLYSGASQQSDVSTQSGAGAIPGLQNTSTTNTPATGYIGEAQYSFVAYDSAVDLTSNVFSNITSISLTPGVWDVTGIVGFVPDTTTSVNQCSGAISSTSATGGTPGDTQNNFNTINTPIVNFGPTVTVPASRVTLTTNTTYYLTARAVYTISTMEAYGRISATRVG